MSFTQFVERHWDLAYEMGESEPFVSYFVHKVLNLILRILKKVFEILKINFLWK